MTPKRTVVYAALVAHLLAALKTSPAAGAVVFKTVEDGVRDFANVPPAERPYLGLTMAGETPHYLDATHGRPKAWTLSPAGWVYIRTKDDRGRPQASLATVLDALDDAIAPPPFEDFQTLGGVVHSARFMGTTETDEGNLGEDAVARVTFQLIVDAD